MTASLTETSDRKRKGEGSVCQIASGKWRVRVYMPDGRRHTSTYASREEAERVLVALRAELYESEQRGELAAAETLRTWGERWLDRRELQHATRYTGDERARWAKYIAASPLADLPLEQLRRRDVRAWLDALFATRTRSGRGRTTLRWQTVANAFALLRKALADAVDAELIAASPAAGVQLPRRREQHEFKYLTLDEVTRVLGCEAIPVDTRRLYAVAIFTGLRAGELWALRWGDVALEGERPELTVRRSHHNKPKNGKVQTVPLLAPAREALEALKATARASEADDLVFPTERGHQRLRGDDAGWSSRRVRGKPRVGYRERAGVTRPVLFKELRHTCATHLVQGNWGNDWPIADVSKFLRHSGVAVTQRYADVSPNHLAERARNTPATVPAVSQSAHPIGTRSEGPSRNPSKPLASPGRVELPTNGLGNQRSTAAVASQNASRDPSVTQCGRALALALLEAVEAGEAVGAHVEALCAAVLDAPAVKLAQAVREGGPFRVRRALDLAELVLAGEGMAHEREALPA